MKAVIIDGYVDEPTCLGVPPSVSTYVRYTAGALKEGGAEITDLVTIEQLRDTEFKLNGRYSLAVLIAGNPVPGKYLGGMPIQFHEFDLIAKNNPGITILCGGPVRFDQSVTAHSNLEFISGDIEKAVILYLQGKPYKNAVRSIEEVNRFAVSGAHIISRYPRFPYIICELETARGCPRKTHCSFCVEGLYPVEYRSPADVGSETRALYDAGARYFRLGKQPDLLAYGSRMLDWKNGFPKPEIGMVRELYERVRDAAPELSVLHLDNVNPGTIINFPDESGRILETIAEFNTPGDVAAFGMESADPAVIEKNGLKGTAQQMLTAVAIVNQAGGARKEGLPSLLPGINLIRGLSGETRDTFRYNYEFLKQVLDSGSLLRRINIRQIRRTPGTPLRSVKMPDAREEKKLDASFRKYREMIRREVDEPMLRLVYPRGTVLHGLIVEAWRGDWSLARALGSYPVAVNLPRNLPLYTRLSVFVTGYRERSLIGLPYPFMLSGASLSELKQLPGIGSSAGMIFTKRAGRLDWLKKLPGFENWGHCIKE